MTKQLLAISLILTCCWACSSTNEASADTAPSTTWQLDTIWQLDSIAPIGLAYYKDALWLSDGDHNRLVRWSMTDEQPNLFIDGLERPMHLDATANALYIPEYGKDVITMLTPGQAATTYPLTEALDAPAGVSVAGSKVAIADFYNHRVLAYDGSQWQIIGQKGQEDGALHYPTDVQWHQDRLYVADAYNHRVQVWDAQGNWLQTIGAEDGLNAATGIYLKDNDLWVTDFENSRLLRYHTDGTWQQTISKELNKPTDVLQVGNAIYVTNYGSRTLMRLIAS